MVIYEKLTFQKYLLEFIQGRSCFYYRKSISARVLDKILRHFKNLKPRSYKIRKLVWGENEYINSSVRDASRNARDYLNEMPDVWNLFADGHKEKFDIKMDFLFKKYVFTDLLYKKYFFYELCIQYAKENKNLNENILLVLENRFIGPYEEIFKKASLKVRKIKRFYLFRILGALFSILLAIQVYWKNKISKKSINFNNKIICNVYGPEMIKVYEDIFSHDFDIKYVVPEGNINYFTEENTYRKVHPLYLSSEALDQIKKIQKLYFLVVLKNFKKFISFGFDLFYFFNRIIHGRIKAPTGSGNYILTGEHHDLINSIRNEFIRSQGSKSILFPSCSLYVMQYYPEEFFANYDYICSPGRQYDDTLLQNESNENCLNLPVGQFSVHKHGINQDLNLIQTKTSEIQSFIGNDNVITILSPGICKPTYHSEVKLVSLALKLAATKGVKVIFRQKPFVPEECYINFYEGLLNHPSILLTGAEYELFDFLSLTDLFITSYSTAACELAMCGASILFIDFLEQNDRFIFWRSEIIGGLLLSEHEAFDKILELLSSSQEEEVKKKYISDLEKFAEYIGYRFDSFESYRENTLSQLSINVFQDQAILTG